MTKLFTLLFLTQVILFSQSNQANDFSYAIKLYHDKFYDLSIKEFDKFINTYPHSTQRPDAMYYLALSYFFYKDMDRALQYFRRTAIDYPKYLKADEAWFKSGEILRYKERWNDAATAFEIIKLLYSKSSRTAQALYLASKMYEKAGNQDKAMFTCRVVLDEYSESNYAQRAKIQLIRLLRLHGRLEEAKLELSNLKNHPTIELDIRFEKAQIAQLEQNYQSAESQLLKISKSHKRFDQMNLVMMALGDLNFRRNNYKLAQIFYERSKKLNTNKKIIEKLADIYFLTKQIEKAKSAYQKLDPLNAKIKLVLCLKFLKQYSEAEKILRNILKQNKKMPPLLFDKLVYERALLLEKLNKQIEIVSFLRRVSSLVDNKKISLLLAKILGNSYEKRSEYDLALGTYNHFLLSNPDYFKNDVLLWEKANLLDKLNRFPDALIVYGEIIRSYPLSIVYQKAKNKVKHREQANKITKQNIYQSFSSLLASIINGTNKAQMYEKLADLNSDKLARYETGINYYKKALSLENKLNKRVKLYMKLANSYMKLAFVNNSDSLYKSASKNYKLVLQSKPNTFLKFKASVGLIKSELKQIKSLNERSKKAIKEYTTLATENSTHPEIDNIRLSLIDYYKKTNNTQAAISTLKDIKSIDKRENVFFELGKLYLKSDSLFRAADYFKEVLSNFPASRKRYFVLKKLASIEAKLGRKENSILFKKMMADEFPEIENETNKTEIIQYLLTKENIKEAKKYVNFSQKNLQTNDFILNKEFNLISHERLLQIATIYGFDGKNDEAIQYYLDYLRFSSNEELANQIYTSIAQIYIEKNQKKLAIQYFEKIKKNYYNYKQIEQALAILYFQMEEYSKAIKYTSRVLKQIDKNNPAYITLNRNLLISQIKSRGLTNFRSQLKAYHKKFPSDIEGQSLILYEYAKMERKKKNFTRSNKILNEIIDDYDESSYVDDASYLIGLNYVTVNNFEKAMDILGDFPKNFPNSSILAKYYNSMGSIFEQFGKTDQAVEAYKTALISAKNDDMKKLSYAKLISIYNKMGLPESVISNATTFIQLYPTDPKIFDIKIMIGQALVNLNRGIEAVSYLKQLKLEANSESEPEVQYWIANTYYKMKQYESAISEYVKIPLLSKKTKLQWVPSALFYAGQSYEKLGKRQDAIRMYERILNTVGIDAVFKKDARKRIKKLKND